MTTPTDALIEKMARAIFGRGVFDRNHDHEHVIRTWNAKSNDAKEAYIEYARAAYSAEHEEDGK